MFLSVKRLLTIWVFYRFPAKNVDDDNIFSANLAENNEIKDVSLKKGQKYMVTELSINSKHDPDVIISDLNARNSLSEKIFWCVWDKDIYLKRRNNNGICI